MKITGKESKNRSESTNYRGLHTGGGQRGQAREKTKSFAVDLEGWRGRGGGRKLQLPPRFRKLTPLLSFYSPEEGIDDVAVITLATIKWKKKEENGARRRSAHPLPSALRWLQLACPELHNRVATTHAHQTEEKIISKKEVPLPLCCQKPPLPPLTMDPPSVPPRFVGLSCPLAPPFIICVQ